MSAGGFCVRFKSPEEKYEVEINDDGRVAYGYMFDPSGHICSDVWIYNRCIAPIEPEWYDRDRAPFANSAQFIVNDPGFMLPCSGNDFFVGWIVLNDHCSAEISINQHIVAVLVAGVKPGWAILARNDGPLAKALKDGTA